MQEEIRVAYGKAVRAIRQDKKISQEELGDLCGLHRTYISDIELGKRNALQVKKSELFIEVEQYEGI